MNEQKQNPYEETKPKTKLDAISFDQAYAWLKRFSIKGRIGRMRYISFSLGTLTLATIIAILVVSIPAVGLTLLALTLIAAAITMLVLSIRRGHDFNVPAWLSAILIIFMPVLTLVMYFIPGTKGDNNYGASPPENTKAIVVSAILFPILYSLAIVILTLAPMVDVFKHMLK